MLGKVFTFDGDGNIQGCDATANSVQNFILNRCFLFNCIFTDVITKWNRTLLEFDALLEQISIRS